MTKDEIIRMAREAGFLGYESRAEEIHKFAALVAKAEREACAQLCEDHFMSDGDWCAKQIRKRSTNEVQVSP